MFKQRDIVTSSLTLAQIYGLLEKKYRHKNFTFKTSH